MKSRYTRHLECPRCHHAIVSLHYRRHFRRCHGLQDGARCVVCQDFIPCRKTRCPRHVKPNEIDAGAAPTTALLKSMKMQATKNEDGTWTVRADWLDGPITRATWHEAYWSAVKAGAP